MEPNHKLLIIYDYFDPAYKAGGPIRSLVNLVRLLEGAFKISIITTNQDHDGTELKVKTNCWLEFGKNTRVQYLSGPKRNYRDISRLIQEVNPNTIYLNGIYSLRFFLFPLLACRNMKNVKVVIAPRGMLQQGALKIKSLKKKLFLSIFNNFFPTRSYIWHATDEQEFIDIKKQIGEVVIFNAGNIPHFLNPLSFAETVQSGDFVSISLIARKKNHIEFIKALKGFGSERRLTYHIYGPIADKEYFDQIMNEIKVLSQNVKVLYKGTIHPQFVSQVLSQYRFYVLTSHGENFGHSIFEAFNQGIPVIISDHTPWKNLFERKAGWDVDIKESGSLKFAIEKALGLDAKTYLEFRQGARRIAEEYMESNDFVKLYKELFGN